MYPLNIFSYPGEHIRFTNRAGGPPGGDTSDLAFVDERCTTISKTSSLASVGQSTDLGVVDVSAGVEVHVVTLFRGDRLQGGVLKAIRRFFGIILGTPANHC